MSLGIDVDEIARVLLADGWHEVVDKSFTLDAYEYMWEHDLLHGGGASGICATGFLFKTTGTISGSPRTSVMAGPLTSKLAVGY